MPRICRPINPMEGRDYLTLDDRVRPKASLVTVSYRGVKKMRTIPSSIGARCPSLEDKVMPRDRRKDQAFNRIGSA